MTFGRLGKRLNSLDLKSSLRRQFAGSNPAPAIIALWCSGQAYWALNIICEKRNIKDTKNKTIARIFIQNKSNLERKEQMNR